MLQDLEKLIKNCRAKFDALPDSGDVYISPELKVLLKSVLEKKMEGNKKNNSKTHYEIRDYSISETNDENLRADLPSSWLWYAYCFYELAQALNEYKEFKKEFYRDAKSDGINTTEMDKFFVALPSNEYNNQQSKQALFLRNYVNTKYKGEEKENLIKFLSQKEWWFAPTKIDDINKGRTLERSDVYQSSLLLAMRVIAANADRLPAMINTFCSSNELRDEFDRHAKKLILDAKVEPSLSNLEFIGINKIFYGAPGTGKSHTVDKIAKNGTVIRTVFHPDTQYSDFVGTLKPKTRTDSNNDTRILYEFRPGPFTEAYIKAMQGKESGKKVYLIIEELNRAPAAAVFGELFQLLDREPNGKSKYKINIADPDMLEYINSILEPKIRFLELPENLTILATMNSSDQAVMPMDTAFKRRWSFEYIRIDYKNASLGSLELITSLKGANNPVTITWAKFAEIINRKLKDLQIPEDRLLGHRFLSDTELKDLGTAKQALSGKLFVYLWDDVLRHGNRGAIFRTEYYNTFGDLNDAFLKSEPVFSDAVDESIIEAMLDEPKLVQEGENVQDGETKIE